LRGQRQLRPPRAAGLETGGWLVSDSITVEIELAAQGAAIVQVAAA